MGWRKYKTVLRTFLTKHVPSLFKKNMYVCSMCSISGFIDLKKESSEEIMARMSDTMIHRGPDGSGVLVLNEDLAQLGFGHRRLAIIDLSEHGRQPMQYQQYTICFNVRGYVSGVVLLFSNKAPRILISSGFS